MQRIFPRALVACIAEGRYPAVHEVAIVANKMRREARLPPIAASARNAVSMARVALGGDGMARLRG